MANGYYAPFYRSPYFNANPQVQTPMQQMPDMSAQYQVPQMNAPQYQMPQAPATSSDMLWVLNENEASSYPVAPGNTVTLWDKNEPTIYIKSADVHGMPSMRILDFTERVQNAPQSSQRRGNVDEGKYVGADAFASLRTEFEELRARVDGLTTKTAKSKKAEENE